MLGPSVTSGSAGVVVASGSHPLTHVQRASLLVRPSCVGAPLAVLGPYILSWPLSKGSEHCSHVGCTLCTHGLRARLQVRPGELYLSWGIWRRRKACVTCASKLR